MLGRDFWITSLPIPKLNKWLKIKDRAKRLELEWSQHVECSFGKKNANHNNEIFQKPFLNLWASGDYKIPLFLPNTTRVEDGKRGIISPVKLNKNFTNSLDLLDTIFIPKEKTLKLSTATLLSARFPYVNPGGEIDKIGHFVDGGYYENTATQTAKAIWKTCKNMQVIKTLFLII